MAVHLEVYKEKGNAKKRAQYRWRKVGPNGRIVAVSGEGFNKRRYAAYAAAKQAGCPTCGSRLPVIHDNGSDLRHPGRKLSAQDRKARQAARKQQSAQMPAPVL